MKNQTSLQHKSSPGQSIAPALGASLVERGGSCGGGDAGGAPRPTSALQHERRPAHEPVIIGDSISCTSQGFIMNLPRLQFVRLAASAAALPVAARLAWAQTYPTRPVRMIVPFAPGGPTDIVARLLTQKLGEHLGRQFYVENVAGAGGNLGMRAAARAAPDGYTLALVSSSYMVKSQGPIRPGQGFRPGHSSRLRAERAARESVAAGQERQGARRFRAGEPGQAKLCVRGDGNHALFVRRIVQAVARVRSRARAIQQRRRSSRPSAATLSSPSSSSRQRYRTSRKEACGDSLS
jgi:Tripartite tricarboxylate transporter family receptor